MKRPGADSLDRPTDSDLSVSSSEQVREMGVVSYRGTAMAAVIALMVGTIGLAGCGYTARWGSDAAASSSDEASGSASSPSELAAKDGTDLKACHDGDCEVLVTEPVDISIDEEKFNLVEVSVDEIDSDSVTFSASPASGGYLQATVSTGGTASLNGLKITVTDIADGSAVLKFWT